MKRICVQWPRFGPYHLARLRATHRLFQERGVEAIGLETAGDDATYAWDVEQDEEPFRRVQVFPNRVFETIPAAEMRDGVTATLDRLAPDVVAIVSYSFPDARAALGWCRRHGRTAVLMASTREEDAARVGWREWVKARIVGEYDAALVAGTPQRRYLTKLGFPSDKIFQPCTAVDNAFFREGAARARRQPTAYGHLPGLDSDVPFFLTSNRFIPRKNLDRLLLAYERYRERAPAPWRLLLLGDGPERPHLEATIRDRQIEGVVLCGFRQIDELPVYYGLAGAFVHPCLMDQWGLVVNEAMAAGLPVAVSTAAGCTGDLVNDGENGYAFDPLDGDALTRVLLDLASPAADRDRMGARSQEIVAGWAPERFAEGLWAAAEAGQTTAERGLSPIAHTLLWALRQAGSGPKSFHSVDAAST